MAGLQCGSPEVVFLRDSKSSGQGIHSKGDGVYGFERGNIFQCSVSVVVNFLDSCSTQALENLYFVLGENILQVIPEVELGWKISGMH